MIDTLQVLIVNFVELQIEKKTSENKRHAIERNVAHFFHSKTSHKNSLNRI